MSPHQHRQHEARDGAEQRGIHRADRAVEEIHRRPRRPAERAAETVDAEGAAQPLRIDRGVEQREIGGMEHGVAEAAQHGDDGKAREGVHEGEQAQRDAERQQAAGQDRPRAEAIDGKARRGLAEARTA